LELVYYRIPVDSGFGLDRFHYTIYHIMNNNYLYN
jgi:hypothetical protein